MVRARTNGAPVSLLLALACIVGCTPTDKTTDSGAGDGGADDGGTLDGGTLDGGTTTDGGAPDGGTTDGGAGDGGTGDGGAAYTEAMVSDITTSLNDEYASLLTVSWQQDAPTTAWVEYSVDEGVWRQSPAQDLDVGPASQLLLGIPYDTDVSFRVVNDFGADSATAEPLATAEQAATTGPLPADVPEAHLLTADDSAWDPSMSYVLLSLSTSPGFGDFQVLIIDRQGRVVWSRATPSTAVSFHPRISWDDSYLLVDESTYWAIYDNGAASQVIRMKIDGSSAETIAMPGLYHPFTDLPDGSYAWTAHDGSDDMIVVRDPKGDITEIWDCHADLPGVGGGGYCGSNTLSYNDGADSFLYSSFSADTIVELDATTGDTLRTFGEAKGSWAFDPPDSAFFWQHGGTYTDAGTLLTSSDHNSFRGRETVVREYELDEETQTLVEVWNLGVNEGLYGYQLGEAHRLAGGNTLQNTGQDTRLREATPDKEIVWEVDWDEDVLGRSTPIDDIYMLAP